jgi:hypothetical protein
MTDFYEIVLDGDCEVLKGFVAGYLAAGDLHNEVFVAREFHVEHDSLAHQLAEWIGLVDDRTHLIVPGHVHERIQIGTQRLGDRLKIRLVSSRRVAEARFEFRWQTYNREEADRLRGVFGSPPDGVQLDGYEQNEEMHEEEEGQTGGYAPVHPYEARGSGVAHGNPRAVIVWASDLRDDDFVEVETVRLEYGD